MVVFNIYYKEDNTKKEGFYYLKRFLYAKTFQIIQSSKRKCFH